MSDLDRPLRDAAEQAHEISIMMRALLDAARGPEVTVPSAELEKMVALTSFICGYRLAELRIKEEKEQG